jgi:hypothetical protein
MVGAFSVGPTQELEKKLMAAIALLCVSNTVFAHDIYSNLRDKAGRYCCNGQDCRPVQVIAQSRCSSTSLPPFMAQRRPALAE